MSTATDSRHSSPYISSGTCWDIFFKLQTENQIPCMFDQAVIFLEKLDTGITFEGFSGFCVLNPCRFKLSVPRLIIVGILPALYWQFNL